MITITCLVASAVLQTTPPPTKMIPVEEVIHDTTFVDEYRWLEALESESADVEAWTTSQNDHTRAVLD